MRLLVKRLTVVISMVLFSSLFALPAQADAYWDGVARGFADTHVWQDSNVRVLSAEQVEALKQQINSTGKPIYVAVVDQSRAGSSTADYPESLYGALRRSGVMLVVGPMTFRAAGYDTSEEVAQRAPGIATMVAEDAKSQRAAKAPDFQMASSFVSEVSKLDFTVFAKPAVAGPEQERPASSDSSDSSGSFWWRLAIGMVVFIGLCIFWFVRSTRRKAETYPMNEEPFSYQTYRPAPEPTRPDPTVDRSSAYAAYDKDNLPHVIPTEEEAPVSPSPQRPKNKTKRSRSRGKDNHRDHYSPVRTETHNNYYQGGGGYREGFYPDPFFNAFLASQLMSSNDDGSYSQGFQDGEHHAENTHSSHSTPRASSSDDDSSSRSSSSYSSGHSGGSDWSDSGSSSSSSSFSSSSDSGSSYSSSYDSSSSSSSFDSGSSGGSDF